MHRMRAALYELVSKSLCFLEPLSHSNLIDDLNRMVDFSTTIEELILMAVRGSRIAHRYEFLIDREFINAQK